MGNIDKSHEELINHIVKLENELILLKSKVDADSEERRKIEFALSESEKNYRNLIENISDVIYEIDNVGIIKYISPSIKKILGFTPEEVIGRSFLDFVGGDTVHLKERFRLLVELNEINNEYTIKSKFGEERWIRLSTKAKFENSIFIGGTGTLIDITEKKITELKLQNSESLYFSILNASPDTIAITDLEGIVLFSSPIALKIFGYTEEEQFNNQSVFKFLHPSCYEKARSEIARMYKGGLDGTEEFLGLRADGSSFDIEINGDFIRNEAGQPIKMIFIVRDISQRKNAEKEILDLNANLELKIEIRTSQLAETNYNLLQKIEEQKKAEEELKKSRIEAEKANIAKSEFLSRMSHELRTPMNSILGFAQLLEMSELNPKQIKSVRHILRSGKLLLNLINEVLDISSIEAGKISLSIEPVKIDVVIREMLDIVNPMANEKQVTIIYEDHPINSLFVKTDKQRLKQVLLNLLNNAIKYNIIGGEVQIKADLTKKENIGKNYIRLSVIDTGPGIDAGDLTRIFVPFERIGAEKSDVEGTGLGLAVVKKLIEAMNGNIGVTSKKGEGSTFWIELPQTDSQIELAVNSDYSHLETSKISNKGKILYIEDNISNIELVEQILSSQRSEISLITLTKGKQSVEKAKENKPDIILLDLNLPDIHGLEVMKMLNSDEETKRIPVIVISADAMPRQIDKLFKEGAKKYLTKPLNLAEFLIAIDEYLVD